MQGEKETHTVFNLLTLLSLTFVIVGLILCKKLVLAASESDVKNAHLFLGDHSDLLRWYRFNKGDISIDLEALGLVNGLVKERHWYIDNSCVPCMALQMRVKHKLRRWAKGSLP